METSYIHKAFKDNDGSGTDFEIKELVQSALKKWGIFAKIPTQKEKYFGVRPDLIDTKKKLVVEVNGSIHEKFKVILQDEFKMKTYKDNGYSILIVDISTFDYLELDSLEQYIAPILVNLKYTNNLDIAI